MGDGGRERRSEPRILAPSLDGVSVGLLRRGVRVEHAASTEVEVGPRRNRVRCASHARPPFSLRPLIAVIAAIGLVAALVVASAAEANKSFRPVRATPHALFFKPSGVAPKVVRKAKVHFRHRGGKTRRHRVPTVNVRTALTSGSLLRVKKPKPARGGKLEIVVDDSPETVSPPVTTPPPTSGCELGSFSADKVPGSCWRPYGDSSPFNRRVPANPQIAAGSAATVSRWVGF